MLNTDWVHTSGGKHVKMKSTEKKDIVMDIRVKIVSYEKFKEKRVFRKEGLNAKFSFIPVLLFRK